ncbi:Poly-gamma-glutamic synthesis PgsA protein-like protein [Planktothrix sp. PCC 11201]|uniref:CapA family protein n=1 Tax=Planktothrix sp. PCC 11201 TaxID=1729650 RepID=UPI000922AC8F|nr:CapA family protein [Planktothrix sp. PCC 11201]SKB11709.1 Poly-gamma-glutamic synthesis PgsA protein-like protein [Planktothrix sp. PCC 11201]
MSDYQTIALAKTGDPKAIAILINQALQSKGVTAKVTRQDHHLQVVLVSEQLPDIQGSVRVVQNGLMRLQSSVIGSVTISGTRRGQKKSGWTQTLVLQEFIPEPLKSPKPPKPPKNQKIGLSFPKLTFPALKVALPKPQVSVSKPWLIVGSVSLMVLPLSGIIVNQNQEKINTFLTEIPQGISSSLAQIPAFSLSTATVSKPNPISKTATIKNLNKVSKLTLKTLENPINPDLQITIRAVGDIIPGTNYPSNKLSANKTALFAGVKSELKGDIVFGNFESTLTQYPNSAKNIGRGLVFAFRTPPEYKALLKDAGFSILNVANNHSFDFFEAGFKDTIQNIKTTGIKAVGEKGKIVYHEVKGIKLAFVGFSNYDYHNNLSDIEAGKKLVTQAQKNADFVVISFHGGAEGTGALNVRNKTEYFYGENRGNLVLFAHSMIDAGADLILGHGPHVPRALELYKGKLIAYSLGNFMGYRTLSTSGELGYSLILEAKVNPQGDFIEGKIIPVQLNSQGIPNLDNRNKSISLIRNLTQKDFPKTPLKIDNNGQILIRKP